MTLPYSILYDRERCTATLTQQPWGKGTILQNWKAPEEVIRNRMIELSRPLSYELKVWDYWRDIAVLASQVLREES